MTVNLDTADRWSIRYALKHEMSIRIDCETATQVYSRTTQINRWRRSVADANPELTRLRICPRPNANPPHILVEYDKAFATELKDADGNPLGVTPATLQQQHEEETKELNMPSITEQQNDKDMQELANMSGMTVTALIQEQTGLTSSQQQAIVEAERQQGRALTQEERQHVLAASNDDDIQLDL